MHNGGSTLQELIDRLNAPACMSFVQFSIARLKMRRLRLLWHAMDWRVKISGDAFYREVLHAELPLAHRGSVRVRDRPLVAREDDN